MSESKFRKGWRPAIGWTCAGGLFWHFLGHQWLEWIVAIWKPAVTAPPEMDVGPLIALTVPLLGLGALRTVEKVRAAQG